MNKDKKDSADKSAEKWQDRFSYQERKLQKMHKQVRKNYDILYANQNNKDKIAPWKSKVFVPILASKAWDLISRMSDVVPLFTVSIKQQLEIGEDGNFAKRKEAIDQEQRISAKLHDDFMCPAGEPMKFKVFNSLVDAVAAGTGFATASWEAEKKVNRTRKQISPGNYSNDKISKKTVNGGKNAFVPENFFDVFPSDDSNGSWQDQSYIIVRGTMPKYRAKKMGWNNLNLAETTGRRTGESALNNAARNRLVEDDSSIITDDTVETITYYICYAKDAQGLTREIYMEGSDKNGGNWVEAQPLDRPFWHDLYPVVPFYTRRKSFTVFGESLFENNKTLQSAVNDLFNHYLDNWNVSIDSMIIIEDGTMTNDFVIQPGGQIKYTGEKPAQWKFPEPNPQQLSVVMSVLEKGVEQATFSQYASGVPNSATDKTQGTAYGIKTISEAATTKIGFFRDNFKQSMKVVGEIWLSNLKQFESLPQEVSRDINGQTVPDIIMPSDYQTEAVVDIDDDSMVPLSKQEKMDRHERFVNSLIMQQKAATDQFMIFKQPTDIPRINWIEVFDDTARLGSVKGADRYLLDNTVEIPQPAPEKPTPEEVAFESIAKKYDKADEDIKAQIEEVAGLDVSAMHDTKMVNEAIKMGAEEGQLLNPQEGEMNGQESNGEGSKPSGNSSGSAE